MPQNPQRVGENEGLRAVKTPCLRLSDAAPSTTQDFADIICGDGAPSGGYGRPAGVTMVYLRKDASTAITAAYTTHNGGTTWTAVAGAVPGSDFSTTGIKADVVAESTAAAGVTVDGALIKDNAIGAAATPVVSVTATTIVSDTISEKTAAAGVTADGVLLKDSQVTTDQINEKTPAAGVTVDGCLIQDGRVAALATAAMHTTAELTATGAVQNPAHTIGAFPTDVWCEITAGHDGAGAAGNLVPTVTWGSPKADATNYNLTVTAGAKFILHARK